MLLCDTLCLKYVVLQLLLSTSRIHHKEGNQEHPLILALQLFQERFCVLAISSQIAGNDVDIISGPDSLFLLLDFGTVKLRNGVLDCLNRRCLIHRLQMHGNDQAGIHVQEIRQHPIRDIGSSNSQKRHGPVQISHLENPSFGESKGRGCNKILHGQTGFHQPFPLKEEFVIVSHVEHGMHQVQPFLSIQYPGRSTQTPEIV